MDKLYCLTFYTKPNGDCQEGFHIGLFTTYAEANETKIRYLQEVTGFKDYNCDAEITEVPVIGCSDRLQKVYRFMGWNENKDFDEIDIIQSGCYVDWNQAQVDYEKAQHQTPRQEWVLNCYNIGQCDWREGFVRL